MLIDFDKNNCNSIKLLAVKMNANVKVTSEFMNGKMLTFSKISLASFIYDIIKLMIKPSQMVKREIFFQNLLKRNFNRHRKCIFSIYFYLQSQF